MSTDNKPQDEVSITRRKLLELGTAGSVVGVAGCGQRQTATPGQGTGTGTGTDTATPGKEPREAVYDLSTQFIPTDANWSPWASKKQPSDMRWLVFATPYIRSSSSGKFLWDLLEEDGLEYDANEQSLTWHYKEGFTWWNGDPITAKGRYYNNEFERLYDPEGSSIERNELVDDYTLKVVYKKAQNPNLIAFLRPLENVIPEVIKPFLERMKDASTTTRKDKITKELSEKEIPIEEFVDKGWGNAMYEVTDWSTQGMTLEKREDHPYAGRTDLETLRVNLCAEQAVCDQYIVNDEMDAGDGLLPPRVEDSAPDNLQNLVEFKGVGRLQLLMNQNNKHLRKRKFRRAIAYLLDNKHIRTNIDKGVVLQDQWGMTPDMAERWLGRDTMDKFIDYPARADYDTASSLLQDLGYSKKGTNWVDPNGEVVKFNHPSMNWGDQFTIANKTVSEQLKEFGFKVEFITMDTDTLVNEVYEKANYDVYVNNHYGGYRLHPYDYFHPDTPFGNVYHWPGGYDKMVEWKEQGRDRGAYNGKPLFPTVPTEIGSEEIQGSGEEFDYAKIWKELETVNDEQRETEIIETLAWHWNFDLPGIEVWQGTSGAWGDSKNFEWPAKDDMKVYRPASMMPNLGKVNVTY